MKSPYAPPHQPIPDNIWHVFLIAGVAAFLVWIAGSQVAGTLLAPSPQSAAEQALAEGVGHPLSVWMESISEEDPPFLWNRILALVGWLFTLGALTRLLMSRGMLVSALPTVLILFVYPGMLVWVTSSGLFGLSAWCFVRAYRNAQLEEGTGFWVRGGIWLALAMGLHAVWIVPGILFFVGLFEAKRRALVPMGIAVLATYGVVYGIGLLAGGLYAGGIVSPALPAGSVETLLKRNAFLCASLILMLGFGATRRGIGWWCLTASLLLPAGTLLLGTSRVIFWVPLLMFTAMGLAKLPALLDVRHPRAYLSILVCQLLLWVPAGLDHLESQTESIEAVTVEMQDEN